MPRATDTYPRMLTSWERSRPQEGCSHNSPLPAQMTATMASKPRLSWAPAELLSSTTSSLVDMMPPRNTSAAWVILSAVKFAFPNSELIASVTRWALAWDLSVNFTRPTVSSLKASLNDSSKCLTSFEAARNVAFSRRRTCGAVLLTSSAMVSVAVASDMPKPSAFSVAVSNTFVTFEVMSFPAIAPMPFSIMRAVVLNDAARGVQISIALCNVSFTNDRNLRSLSSCASKMVCWRSDDACVAKDKSSSAFAPTASKVLFAWEVNESTSVSTMAFSGRCPLEMVPVISFSLPITSGQSREVFAAKWSKPVSSTLSQASSSQAAPVA
mmetsp:Transcript_120195/g.375852  ORF Transcript_120195/g.375852 Transcript_120195/m.375852 type:complete len:326 (-) Transcript_120195:143-1120(-)